MHASVIPVGLALQSQKGQVLLEFVVMVSLATALSVWGASHWAQKVRQARIEAMATWLMDIRRATNVGDAQEFDDVHVALGADWQHGRIERLITELKRRARLPSGFSNQPPMDYRVSWQPASPTQCQSGICQGEALLVAIPAAHTNAAEAYQDAVDLLLLLHGQGGVVTWNRPGDVKGPALRYDAVTVSGQLLPTGTIALVLWGGTMPQPYVRLQENRSVALSGSVQMSAGVRFLQAPQADEGLVIGKIVTEGEACQHQQQLALLASGGFALCQSGRWGAMPQAHRFKTCQLPPPVNVFRQGLFSIYNVPGLSSDTLPTCDCEPGFIQRYLGSSVKIFQGVHVNNGFLCELL